MPDPMPTFEPATTCDPTEKPGPQAVRAYVLGRWGGRDLGIVRACAGDLTLSEHHEGRAWDWGFPSEQARLEALAWLERHAWPLGIAYLISHRQMWRAYPHAGNAAGAWSPYTGKSPHLDHVHLSFSWCGARAQTSGYDAAGKVIDDASA